MTPKIFIEVVSREVNRFEPNIVTERYLDGTYYKGEMSQNKRHGKGKFFYTNGGIFVGQWYQGTINGYGTLYYPNSEIAYQGNWMNEKFNGEGILNNDTPEMEPYFEMEDFETLGDSWLRYQGSFERDKKNGHGILYLANGDKFEGNFQNDYLEGEGKYTLADGIVIKGVWKEDQLIKKDSQF